MKRLGIFLLLVSGVPTVATQTSTSIDPTSAKSSEGTDPTKVNDPLTSETDAHASRTYHQGRHLVDYRTLAEIPGEWKQIGQDLDPSRFLSISKSGKVLSLSSSKNEDTEVYELKSGRWKQLGDAIPVGGGVYFSRRGNFLLIANSDHVRVYKWGGTDWDQLGQAVTPSSSRYSVMDASLSDFGEWFQIAVYLYQPVDTVQVQLFSWTRGSKWSQTVAHGNLPPFGNRRVVFSDTGYRFAYPVQGVNYPPNDRTGKAVAVFEKRTVQGDWEQEGDYILGQEGDGRYGFGSSIAMSRYGTRVAIGGYEDLDDGYVRVVEWNGTSWTRMGQDIDGPYRSGDDFGNSLSISNDGNRIAVGARSYYGNSKVNEDPGYAQMFEWDGSSWNKMGPTIEGTNEEDHLGVVSMAGSGHRVAIGSRSRKFVAHFVRTVQIDVRPYSESKNIRLRKKDESATVTVGILGSPSFKGSKVRWHTVRFGPGKAKPIESAFKKINSDEYVDYRVMFKVQDTGLSEGSQEVCLYGKGVAGMMFRGCQNITVTNK